MSRHNATTDHANDPSQSGAGDGPRIAPGKRTLTAGIPSLRGRERDVASFDVSSDYREDRATIDGPPAARLTDRQIQKARRRNPHWQQRLGFSTAPFGGGDIASAELAEHVAEHQASLGLSVDGIAGPRTVAALTAATPADDSEGEAEDRVADTDAPAADDPFGMHLFAQPL